jgi:hypothetical protein
MKGCVGKGRQRNFKREPRKAGRKGPTTTTVKPKKRRFQASRARLWRGNHKIDRCVQYDKGLATFREDHRAGRDLPKVDGSVWEMRKKNLLVCVERYPFFWSGNDGELVIHADTWGLRRERIGGNGFAAAEGNEKSGRGGSCPGNPDESQTLTQICNSQIQMN